MITLKEQLIDDILHYYKPETKLCIFVVIPSIDKIVRPLTIDFDEPNTVLYIHNVYDDDLKNIAVLVESRIVGWEFTTNLSEDDVRITKFPQAFVNRHENKKEEEEK